MVKCLLLWGGSRCLVTDGTYKCLSSEEELVKGFDNFQSRERWSSRKKSCLLIQSKVWNLWVSLKFSRLELYTDRCWIRLLNYVFSNVSSQQIPNTWPHAEQLLGLVIDGCAQRRHQRSKRWGHQGCTDQSHWGVEMCFYPATDLEDSGGLTQQPKAWKELSLALSHYVGHCTCWMLWR